MKLFTKDINQKLFAQYRIGSDLNKQKVVAKIFNPYGRGRWYLLNSDPNDPDYLWAIVQMGDEVEIGSVSRNELESIRIKPHGLPLERDMYFSERNAMEVLDGLEKGKTFAAGGMTAGRYYKDNSGQEFRYIGESQGKLLFKDGEKVVYKQESDFEDAPEEKRRFGFFEDGGMMASGGFSSSDNYIGFIPNDLEEKLAIIAKWGGMNIKEVIGFLNAMIDSGLSDEDLKINPTKNTRFQVEKAEEKKIQEIWQKIEPNYKGGLIGNRYYSVIKAIIERPNYNLLKSFKPYRKYQIYASGGFTSSFSGTPDRRRTTMAKGGVVEPKLVKFKSMYDGMVDAYESVEQKGTYFYVSGDKGQYVVTVESKGFPATEAFDDWMYDYEDALDIAKKLAMGEDFNDYAHGGIIEIGSEGMYRGGAAKVLKYDDKNKMYAIKYLNEDGEIDGDFVMARKDDFEYGFSDFDPKMADGGKISNEEILSKEEVKKLYDRYKYLENLDEQRGGNTGFKNQYKNVINEIEDKYVKKIIENSKYENLKSMYGKKLNFTRFSTNKKLGLSLTTFSKYWMNSGGWKTERLSNEEKDKAIKELKKLFPGIMIEKPTFNSTEYSYGVEQYEFIYMIINFDKYEDGGYMSDGVNGKTINGYDVDYFKTARGVYANIEIPSPNPTFDDDTQIKGFGKDEKEAFNDLKKEFEKYLKSKDNKMAQGGETAKFEVDDVVYHKQHNTIGIVRIGESRGEVKTDADGNVDVDELEYYNPMKHEAHKNAKVAPSTHKEIEERKLWQPFSERASQLAKGGYMANGGELNKGVRKLAASKGFTPKALGKDYEKVMAQAVVEALTDANYHNEARKLVSILEKNPKIAEKPNYPSPSDPKFNEKMAEIKKVYGSEYFEPDEKTRAFGRKVSQEADFDGYEIANAFEFVLKMDGGYQKLANDIKKAVGDSNEMADGGYMAKGAEIEDKFKGKNSKEIWNNLDSSTKAKVLEHLFIKGNTSGVQYYDSYNSLNELSNSEWDKLPKNIKNEIDNFGQKDKMADGGDTDEGVDLFEDYDDIPENVQKVLDKHSDGFEGGDYRHLEKAKKELEKIGYTFEYGLDGTAYDLRKIGQKGKSEDEYAKGGELKNDLLVQFWIAVNKDEKDKMIDLSGKLKNKGVSDELKGYISKNALFAKENFPKKEYDNNHVLKMVKMTISSYNNMSKYAKGGILTDSKKEAILRKKGNIIIFKEVIEPKYESKSIAVTGFVKSRKTGAVKIEGRAYDTQWFESMQDLINAVDWSKWDDEKMAMGGTTKFKDKVESIKASLLKRKKVSPKVQKDYGKTYSPKEAEESAKRIAASQRLKYELKKKFKKGGKTIAQTPAPKKDRVFGSSKNKAGSASSKKSASKIELNESIIKTLSEKAKEYNEKHSSKVSLSTLKAVMRRGMGAFSTSHRPGITRQQWGFARVNKFLLKKGGAKVKAAYIQDDDLL